MLFNVFAAEIISVINIREKTRNNYRSIFKCHIEFPLQGIEISEVSRNHLQQILQNLPPHTRSATLAVLKTIFREALMHGLIEYSPATDYRVPAPIVGRKKFLTWEELKAAELGGGCCPQQFRYPRKSSPYQSFGSWRNQDPIRCSRRAVDLRIRTISKITKNLTEGA